jgi:hypothetical protein
LVSLGHMATIRITSIPPGEAPAEVRAAWIGLELPLKHKKPRRYLGSGVLSGPRSGVQTLIHMLTFRLKVHVGFVVLLAASYRDIGVGTSRGGSMVEGKCIPYQSAAAVLSVSARLLRESATKQTPATWQQWPNPALNRTGRHRARRWFASVRPAG